jgi:hypothetical protein
VRIRVSNVYGRTPLRLAGASVGKAGDGAAVRAGSLRKITFGWVAVDDGAGWPYGSVRPVALSGLALERLSVTFSFRADRTGHLPSAGVRHVVPGHRQPVDPDQRRLRRGGGLRLRDR